MKKFVIVMTCGVLLAAQGAVAQDMSLENEALQKVTVEKEAPQQEIPTVEAPKVESSKVETPKPITPKTETPEKAVPKKKKQHKKKVTPQKQSAEPNLMFRKKDEIGRGAMFREKPMENPLEKSSNNTATLISAEDCQYLTAYQPKVDGDAGYKPGVDAHGKPVMEADITPAVIQPPEKTRFDLTVDLAKYMGIAVPAGFEGKANMGTITVERGQVKFNGKPLEGDAEAALKALCAPHNIVKAPK
ncbi:MAG: hypothetical protein HY052_01240 [Proteobacteria bacterium]|nr:hypothetical protein [Pseudomonadota bacterium]